MGTVSPINGHIDYTWPEWISVDFKLPEESGEYLCVIKNHKNNETYIDTYKFVIEESVRWAAIWKYCQITHWMPLPPLPRED